MFRRHITATGLALGVTATAVLCSVVPAGAEWSGTHAGSLAGRAAELPPGPAPSASANGNAVDLSWPATVVAEGTNAHGYEVVRYGSEGAPHAAAGTCGGVVTTTSCTDSDVAEGTWSYRVRVVHHAWSGLEGPASAPVEVTEPDDGTPDDDTSDTTAPVVSVVVVAKEAGGDTGHVRRDGTYHLYASASDQGEHATGITSVHADVRALTTGSTAVVLTAGSYVLNGTTYGYRSPLLTASAAIGDRSDTVSVRATDGAGNQTTALVQVVVDNTAPSTVDVQTVNGGTAGTPDAGDRLTLTYSEPIDAHSILPGWSGAASTVTVRLSRTGNTNLIEVYDAANTTITRVGTITLSQRFVTKTVTFRSSTLVRADNTVTVTLGTPDGTTSSITSPATMDWTPGAGGTDRAGNPLPTTSRTESGPADVDF